MSKVFFKYASVFLTILLAGGCSSDSDNGGEAGASYLGNWVSQCVLLQIDSARDTYFTRTMQIEDSQWQYVQSGYFDEGCTIQTLGSAETGDLSERGTTTISGTYTDEGLLTTPVGLMANKLTSTITAFENTLDEPGTVNSSVGTTADVLVFVNDADDFFLDGTLIGFGEQAGSLVLTLPFTRN